MPLSLRGGVDDRAGRRASWRRCWPSCSTARSTEADLVGDRRCRISAPRPLRGARRALHRPARARRGEPAGGAGREAGSRCAATRRWSAASPPRSPPKRERWAAEGFATFKLKVGAGDDVGQVRAVREALGPRRGSGSTRTAPGASRTATRIARRARAARDRAGRAAGRRPPRVAELARRDRDPARRRREHRHAVDARRARASWAPATLAGVKLAKVGGLERGARDRRGAARPTSPARSTAGRDRRRGSGRAGPDAPRAPASGLAHGLATQRLFAATIAAVECELRGRHAASRRRARPRRRDRRGALDAPPALAWRGALSSHRRQVATTMDPTNANTALASAFVEELARGGLRRAVVSPGSRSTPLAVALWRQPEIEVTVIVDERSAAFFALGAAQASGEPVALLCTSGTARRQLPPGGRRGRRIGAAADRAHRRPAAGAARHRRRPDDRPDQALRRRRCAGSAKSAPTRPTTTGLLHFRSVACRALAAARGEIRARARSTSTCPGASRWRRSRSRAR